MIPFRNHPFQKNENLRPLWKKPKPQKEFKDQTIKTFILNTKQNNEQLCVRVHVGGSNVHCNF